MNPELAQQRAASLLQQQYGSQATASLGAMQQRGIALPGQTQGKPGLQLPGQAPGQSYSQPIKPQQPAQQPRIKTETDGAADDFPVPKRQRIDHDPADADLAEWKNMLAARHALTDDQRARNDATMREQVASLSRELESGLLQPLSCRLPKRPKKSSSRRRKSAGPAVPQLDGDFSDDGADVKDEDDENAINSDLDDSGDELNNAEEDDDEIDSMLCTYDKVQRVKNKWKCTLKDGVLSANGKE